MSMREMSVNAATPVLEERYWDVFPSRCLRFWPLFIRRSRDMAVFLERTNPVLVETRMTGIGSFVTDIKLLSPRIVVEWQGKEWCISKEGRMWSLTDGGFWFRELKIPWKPLWKLPDAGEEGRLLPGGVFPSIFSTDAIDDFLKGLGGASWFDGVEEVSVGRRAGDDFFELRYVREGKDFTILIQRDKHGWEELGLALGHILGSLEGDSGGRLIDATYKDRIVVKNLPAGAAEGSSR
ncbi:MAG: hypothetical protein FWG71_07125 [Synergistaceae bacterium]|nr:hypothetical protein [Synergistaceae bacterium]